MPVPHFNIKITQRSKGNSAVAGAAYQAGEKLFSEYDQKTKNYTCKKEVVYTEIMLPPNAPPEYADRATLWNSVEEIEKQWNSQLARRFVAALPREVPMELLPQMVKEYCEEQFVSKGMCCDFAIHDPDPPGHNPHCHFMLTMRAIDENGKWMPKSRKVYDLDENGERIKLPSGRWKSHKEDTVDWNEQYHAEEWRHGWEIVQNKYLELAGSPERIDMRSYERQGLDIIPTVHMGTAVSALERKGIDNRFVCFDIKELPKNLKKPGMLVIQDQVWNRVTRNRNTGVSTWYYADEFHLLLKEPQTAAYSAEIWKRFRKWGGVPTGATQNVKDLLSSPEIENILENSDFICMLNQAAGDRKILAERLNISPEQLKFVTNSPPGEGLLFFENVILPFADKFPRDTELYRIMSTKPSEVNGV